MDNKLPPEYTPGVPRVSEIVSFVFPFDQAAQDGFQFWLDKLQIDRRDYMDIANGLGTQVHNSLESYILGEKLPDIDDIVLDEVGAGIEYLKQIKGTPVSEIFIQEKSQKYQGTADLMIVTNKKKKSVRLRDWKTFGLAKKYFKSKGYDVNDSIELNKDGSIKLSGSLADKIEATSLQLSLYADALEQQGYIVEDLAVLYIHGDRWFEIPVERWSARDIRRILKSFAHNRAESLKSQVASGAPEGAKIEIKDVKSPLTISMQTSPVKYGALKVGLNLAELDGITPDEALRELVEVHKTLHNLYYENE